MSKIKRKWGWRTDEGSCNVCQTHEKDTVLSISLPTMTFRVCLECARQLRTELDCSIVLMEPPR